MIQQIKSLSDLDSIKKRYNDELNGYQYRILVCGGASCVSSGCSETKAAVLSALEEIGLSEKVKVTVTGCMGSCAVGPVVYFQNDDTYYTKVTPDKATEIIKSHIVNNQVIESYTFYDERANCYYTKMSDIPFFKDQVKITLRNCGVIDFSSIDAYIAKDGYFAFAKALKSGPEKIISEIKASGLRGRGGAGFPTGIKWEAAYKQQSDQKYMICNADEGDPGAFMDRSLLDGDPHSIIEGLMLGGYAIGASQGYIYLRAEYPIAVERLTTAIEEARARGILGSNILGSDFSFDLEIRIGAGAFVCGEETSLMASTEGKRGEPTQKPPFPFEKGLFGKPTIINNVETLACIPAIILNGSEWYASFGTDQSKGTKVFALAGNVVNGGLVEVPIGTILGNLLFEIGGGIPDGKSFKAAQIGGPSGGCLTKEHLNTPLDYESLSKLGAIMGSGGLIVMNEDTCMVDTARYFMDFIRDESCGKCAPCRLGTKRTLEILDRITKGEGTEGDIDLLIELGSVMKDAAMCGLGQTSPNVILSTISNFREEYEEHIEEYCRAGVCSDLFLSPCENACPANVNVADSIALLSTGRYLDAYNLIRQENPFPAVCGRICNHQCESKCRRAQYDDPVSIRDLERFVSDYAFKHESRYSSDIVVAKNGKSVGIVGAGPSGLTCAYYLARLGYLVDVYESQPVAGGVLAFGVPEFRLPKDILQHEIKLITQTGVSIHLNTTVGKDISLEELKRSHDAVYIATGTQLSSRINVPGEDLSGVIHGLDFLRAVNLGKEIEIGEHVAIIGGGASSIDAARTAIRMGAKKVSVLYRRSVRDMPADAREIHDAREEGIEIIPQVAAVRFIGKTQGQNSRVDEIECVRMEMVGFGPDGRRNPNEIPGSNFKIKVDMVIPAVSQFSDFPFISSDEVTASGWENLVIDNKTLLTSIPGVFAGGDLARGSDVAITAIADGKKAAIAIDSYLGGSGVLNKGPAIEIPDIDDDTDEIVEINRFPIDVVAPNDRQNNFVEVSLGYHKLNAIAESMRCLRCDRRS